MAKKQKTFKLPVRLWLLGMMVLALIVAGGIVIVGHVNRYNDAVDMAEMVHIRELSIKASEALMADAPVDPKTGDIYFPEARVYLPALGSPEQLTYSYDAESGELAISSREVFTQLVGRMYGATNIKEVFEVMPKLQACQRGVYLPSEPPKNLTHIDRKEPITLANGKTLYPYIERNCKNLNILAAHLKGLRSY